MLRDWRSTQRWSPAGSVDSEQRVLTDAAVVPPTPEGARALGDRYWSEVEGFTRGLVKAVRSTTGVEIRVLGVGPRLLVLGTPEVGVADGAVTCRYPIVGGFLTRRPGGTLSLAQAGDGPVELRSTITGFFPTLARGPGRAGTLYAQVQSRLHVRVSRRYFRSLLAGGPR